MRGGVFIIGGGAVGRSLGAALKAAGEPLAGVHCRSRESAAIAAEATGAEPSFGELPEHLDSAECVLVAVPDTALGEVTDRALAAGRCRAHQVWLHTAGALGAEALEGIAPDVRAVGAFHPPLAFPPGRLTTVPPGVRFAVDGSAAALDRAARLAATLDGHAVRIPTAARPAYHAATVIASNYLVTLLADSGAVLEKLGLPASDAAQLLTTLSRSALRAVADLGTGPALSGPIRRGDAVAVAEHLAALAGQPEVRDLYRELGRATRRLADSVRELPAQKQRALDALLGDNEEHD